MTPEPLEQPDPDSQMDRWAIRLYEDAFKESVAITEEDFPLRLESMPLEGFHPELRTFRNAG